MTKNLMNVLAVVSGLVMTITLIMINCFGLVALYNVMSTATLLFITSMSYMIGHTDGRKEGKSENERIEIPPTI